jgi:putative peptidoglycan lipid II flippase
LSLVTHFSLALAGAWRAVARLRRTPAADWPLLRFGTADGAAIYALAYLASATLGVLRQVLFNAQFGLGEAAAAYYAAFRLPETIGLLIAGGTLTNALVPILLRVEARDGEPAAHRLLDRTLTLLLALLLPLGALAALAAPLVVRHLLVPGLTPDAQALTVSLTRIMLLEVLLLSAEATLGALLVARGQLLLPALAIAARNITLIGGVGLSAALPAPEIYAPTVGAVLDAGLQLAILAPGLLRRGYRPRLDWAPGDRDLRVVLALLGPSAISALVNYGGGVADTAFASLAGGAPALGAVVNALLLVGLPLRLLGMAIGQAALPQLSALALAGDEAGTRRALARTLGVGCALAALAALPLIIGGRPLIGLLFERGAFDAPAADLTYRALAIFALGLPAYVATEIVARAFIARLDTRTPLLANIGQLALRVALTAALLGPAGVLAVPLAYAISAAAEAATLLLVLNRRLAPLA